MITLNLKSCPLRGNATPLPTSQVSPALNLMVGPSWLDRIPEDGSPAFPRLGQRSLLLESLWNTDYRSGPLGSWGTQDESNKS
eukprot:1081322-Amphidinium_carterae.1